MVENSNTSVNESSIYRHIEQTVNRTIFWGRIVLLLVTFASVGFTSAILVVDDRSYSRNEKLDAINYWSTVISYCLVATVICLITSVLVLIHQRAVIFPLAFDSRYIENNIVFISYKSDDKKIVKI